MLNRTFLFGASDSLSGLGLAAERLPDTWTSSSRLAIDFSRVWENRGNAKALSSGLSHKGEPSS